MMPEAPRTRIRTRTRYVRACFVGRHMAAVAIMVCLEGAGSRCLWRIEMPSSEFECRRAEGRSAEQL